jgi:GTP-binding protein LepA
MEKTTVERCVVSVLPESSAALGFGFRCGFLGMLHMEIFKRLEREFNMTVITTVLTFRIMLLLKDPDTVLIVNNPSDLPEPSRLDHVESRSSRLLLLQNPIMLVT